MLGKQKIAFLLKNHAYYLMQFSAMWDSIQFDVPVIEMSDQRVQDLQWNGKLIFHVQSNANIYKQIVAIDRMFAGKEIGAMRLLPGSWMILERSRSAKKISP